MFLQFLLLFALFATRLATPCVRKTYATGQVCVCNATYCDTIEPLDKRIVAGHYVVYESSLAGARLKKRVIRKRLAGDDFVADTIVTIDASQTLQSIIGYGGAFTDATGYNLMSATSEAIRDAVIASYFGVGGLEYNLARVPIGSTDFSTHAYSYDDVVGDYDLKHFQLAQEDLIFKIPFIKQAFDLRPDLKLFASSWSPPAWMKDNKKMINGGNLLPTPLIHRTYADYLARFFDDYASQHNVHFWGMTVQNEPQTSGRDSWKWQSLRLTPQMERDFLRDFLAPRLKQGKSTENLVVMVLDDVRTDLVNTTNTIFNDPIAGEFAAGTAVHWYDDSLTPVSVFDTTHNNHPTKFLLATEACLSFETSSGPEMGSWRRAEELATSQIDYLNHWVTGWVDWNMVLNEKGGPNWVNNAVDAPIIMNLTGREFYKQPIFYATGHFSKFFTSESRVIWHDANNRVLENIACAKTAGERRVCVILNKEESWINATFDDVETGQQFVIEITPRSIQTVIWEKN